LKGFLRLPQGKGGGWKNSARAFVSLLGGEKKRGRREKRKSLLFSLPPYNISRNCPGPGKGRKGRGRGKKPDDFFSGCQEGERKKGNGMNPLPFEKENGRMCFLPIQERRGKKEREEEGGSSPVWPRCCFLFSPANSEGEKWGGRTALSTWGVPIFCRGEEGDRRTKGSAGSSLAAPGEKGKGRGRARQAAPIGGVCPDVKKNGEKGRGEEGKGVVGKMVSG